jgi:hypothetical protein
MVTSREAEIAEECITSQGVRIIVRAVAVFRGRSILGFKPSSSPPSPPCRRK